MIPFLLYTSAAFATGWQISQQILMGVWGKPSNPIEHLAFYGSLLLLLSGYVALFSPHRAAWAAIVSMVPLWVFYLPATVDGIDGIVQRRYLFEALAFIPLLLLVVATVHSAASAIRPLRGKRGNVFFPEPVSRRVRWVIFSLTGLSFFSLVIIRSLFVGLEREQIAGVDWSIDSEGARSVARFKFRQLSGFDHIETDSEEVLQYLHHNQPRDLSVRVFVTYDFGKVRALSLNYAYLGPIRFRPYVEREP